MNDDDWLMPDRKVRERLGGISAMTLWRWERSADLAFPSAIVINRRKYRRARDVQAFEIRLQKFRNSIEPTRLLEAAIAPPVTQEEPRVTRADDDGLLNAKFILANAVRFKRVSAIYFLTTSDEIVYVGQATDVFARLRQHIAEGTKRFSDVFILRHEQADMDRVERAYIRKFRPRYNLAMNYPDAGTNLAIQAPATESEHAADDDGNEKRTESLPPVPSKKNRRSREIA